MVGIISDLKVLEWLPLVQLVVNVLLNNFFCTCV